MHEIEMLEDTCEMLNRELERANAKLTKSGGDMSVGDLDYIDKLTHAIKSVKTTLAMLESDGYSHGYDYADGDMSMREGGSYARGGGRNRNYSRARRRDRMGRYSTEGYSYADNAEMIEDLRELMQDAKDPKTKEEFKHFIKRLEGL